MTLAEGTPGIATLELAADTLTPVSAALRLGSRCAFLLESVEGGVRYGRHSILGVAGRTLVVRGDQATIDGETFSADCGSPIRLKPAQPLSFVRLAA